jgi:5-formyltetrahydrofolate cyclo-ligase
VTARPRSTLKVRANLVGLIVFQRTGVRLAAGQAEFGQYIKNLTALDFHLAREIVDSNLTHPPLFKMCYPKPVSRS